MLREAGPSSKERGEPASNGPEDQKGQEQTEAEKALADLEEQKRLLLEDIAARTQRLTDVRKEVAAGDQKFTAKAAGLSEDDWLAKQAKRINSDPSRAEEAQLLKEREIQTSEDDQRLEEMDRQIRVLRNKIRAEKKPEDEEAPLAA